MKPLVIALSILLAGGLSGAEMTLQLSDTHGKAHTPLVAGDHKAVVLVFVSPFCPTANTFMPEVNNIAQEYADRFAFYLVEADAGLSLSDAKKHAETMGIKATLLLDPEQRLVRLTKAKMTPEVVVLATNGATLYQGRINDLYATQTRKLKEPKTHDLRLALDAISAGQPVGTPSTKAIGCSISP